MKLIERLLALVASSPEAARTCAAVALLALVAYLDIATPPYIDITGFYFFPIFFAIWYCPTAASVFVVAASVVSNFYAGYSLTPTGSPLWHYLLSAGSRLVVFVGFSMLISVLKGKVQRLNEEARIDLLTGLDNRRSFFENLKLELHRAKRHGKGYALALIDIDNFKHVNDTQGHAAGDALLAEIGKCLRSTLRNIDVACRLGGDEFIVLLPRTTKEEARNVLDRVQEELRRIAQSYSERASASTGCIVVSDGLNVMPDDLMEKVDSVMYAVKNRSKDAMVIVSVT